MLRHVVAAAGIAAALTLVPTGTAQATGCATHADYDSLMQGLSSDQVANRLETDGWFIATGQTFYKRGYAACWDSTRKVVVWYLLSTGLSDHWDVRDQ